MRIIMGGYGTSRLRIFLLMGLLIIAGYFGAKGFAQSSGAAPVPAPAAAPAPAAPAPAAPAPSAPAPAASGASPSPAPATPGGSAGANAPALQGRPRAGLTDLILSNIDFIFITIAALSVCGLALIIQGFIKNRASVFMPDSSTNQMRELIMQRRWQELLDFTETDPSFVSKVLNPALKRAPSFSSMKEAMETAVGEQTAEAFRRIEYLNIIGNLGPLLGLLGTVVGMIYAFQVMNERGGQANPADLAGGISMALCHTFLGLMLAVPCLAFFGWFRTVVDRLTVRGALVAEDLLMMIKPSESQAVQRPPIAHAVAAQRAAGAPGMAQTNPSAPGVMPPRPTMAPTPRPGS
jgi:biopolymer transport protein ExbB